MNTLVTSCLISVVYHVLVICLFANTGLIFTDAVLSSFPCELTKKS